MSEIEAKDYVSKKKSHLMMNTGAAIGALIAAAAVFEPNLSVVSQTDPYFWIAAFLFVIFAGEARDDANKLEVYKAMQDSKKE